MFSEDGRQPIVPGADANHEFLPGQGRKRRGEVNKHSFMFRGEGRHMSRVKRYLPVAGLGLGVVMTGAWAGFLGFELFKFVGLFF